MLEREHRGIVPSFTCWLSEGGISKAREKMTVSFTSILVPPAVELFGTEKKTVLPPKDRGDDEEEAAPSLFVRCPASAGGRPSFICCSDLEYCSPSGGEGFFTERPNGETSRPAESRGAWRSLPEGSRTSASASSEGRVRKAGPGNGREEERGDKEDPRGGEREERGVFSLRHGTRRDVWEPVMTEVAV